MIHTHLYALNYAVLAKLFLRIPGVHTVHNMAEKEATPKDQKVNRFFYHRHMALPVSLSDEIQETVMALYRLPPQGCPVVLNGVDLTKCQPKTDYAPHDPIRILHVGRFSEQKNHACMIEALAALPRHTFRLDFFGEGELLEDIRAQAAQNGLESEVHFNGTTDRIHPHLAAADMFILPSKWEGVPMSIIEAMGTGLPIIASRVGGVSDMLTDDQSGLLIEPDATELAAAIERLAGSEELRRTLGQHALADSERFSAVQMARHYVEIYESLIK